MWLNPKTGKGWTDEEEAAFLEIQQVSRLNRIESIQLFRRFKGSREKAVAVAKAHYPVPRESQLNRLAKARQAKKAKAVAGSS